MSGKRGRSTASKKQDKGNGNRKKDAVTTSTSSIVSATKARKRRNTSKSQSSIESMPPPLNSSSEFSNILHFLASLSKSQSRCSFALQAIIDESKEHEGQGSADTVFHCHDDARLLIVATYSINHLIKALREETKSVERSIDEHKCCIKKTSVLSVACYLLAKCILMDRSRLEKCASIGSSSSALLCPRSIIGRAIVSITIGSSLSSDYLCNSLRHISLMEKKILCQNEKEENMDKLVTNCVWCSLLAIEMMVHLSSKPSLASITFWECFTPTINNEFIYEEEMRDACLLADQELVDAQENALNIILGKDEAEIISRGDDLEPSSKRQRKSKTKTTESSAECELNKFIPPEAYATFDGRMSVRRWASMCFVWLCEGQRLALKVVESMLEHDSWSIMLDSTFSCSVIKRKDENILKKPSAARAQTRKATQMKKKSASADDSNENVTTSAKVSGHVVRVAIAARIIDLVAETGRNCGARSPSGGIDIYAGIILGLVDVKLQASSTPPPAQVAALASSNRNSRIPTTRSIRTRRSTSSAGMDAEPTKLKQPPGFNSSFISEQYRPDIRDLAVKIIFRLIHAHSECISLMTTTPHALLNQGGFMHNFIMGQNETISYYPEVHLALDILTRSAASSIVTSAQNDVSDGIARLSSISCALIFGKISSSSNFDAKLLTMTISKLDETLSGVLSPNSLESNKSLKESDKISGIDDKKCSTEASVVSTMGIGRPLTLCYDEYAISQRRSVSEFCNFGGIFPEKLDKRVPIRHWEVLSLYARSVSSELSNVDLSDETSVKVNANAFGHSFLMKLLYVLDISYGAENQSITSRSTRIAIATDTLNILIKCLSVQKNSPVWLMNLIKVFRESISVKFIEQFVSMHKQFQNFLFNIPSSDDVSKGGLKVQKSENVENKSKTFTMYEKQLWSAHITLCTLIGRGQTSLLQNEEFSLMGDSSCRLRIFESIALSCSLSPKEKPSCIWPLALPIPHQALILSNLASEDDINDKNIGSAEKFICESTLESILNLLNNFHVMSERRHFKSTTEQEGTTLINLNPFDGSFVPLSLRDSRIFALSFGRLPNDEQIHFVSKFISALHSFFETQKEKLSSVAENSSGASGFLGRLVVVLSTIINVVYAGKDLLTILKREARAIDNTISSISGSTKVDEKEDCINHESGWHISDKCFLGMFTDWESSSIFLMNYPSNIRYLSIDCISKVRRIYEIGLGIGFLSARADNSHLLYAAWNASIYLMGWEKGYVWEASRTKRGSNLSDPQLLLNVREDMCGFYCMLNQDSLSESTESLISWMIRKIDERSNVFRYKKHIILTEGITNVVNILEGIVTKMSSSKSIVTTQYSVLESLMIYLSFLISNFTVCQSEDFFSACNHKQKSKNYINLAEKKISDHPGESALDEDGMMDEEEGNILSDESGDSDGGYPDFGDDDDEEAARLDALSGLHDAVNVMGAAPLHPDWLDSNCKMQKNVDFFVAIEAAEKSLRSLTEICQLAYGKHRSALESALSLSCGENAFIEHSTLKKSEVAIAMLTCYYEDNEQNGSPAYHSGDDSHNSFLEEISKLTGIDEMFLDRLGDVHSFEKVFGVRENIWCSNTAHVIRGKLQEPRPEGWELSSGEQRAAGEWEMLLADVFVGPFLGGDGDQKDNSLDQNLFSEHCVIVETNEAGVNDISGHRGRISSLEKEFINAERWAKVLYTGLTSLVSTAALLRFALNNGKGSHQHPWSKRDRNLSESLLLVTPFVSSNTKDINILSQNNLLRESVLSTVSNTLTFLGKLSSDGILTNNFHNTCRAAAVHLVNDPSTIKNLEGMHILQNCESALYSLQEISRDDVNANSISDLFGFLIKVVNRVSDEELICPAECSPVKRNEKPTSGVRVSAGRSKVRKIVKMFKLKRLLSYVGLIRLKTFENIIEVGKNDFFEVLFKSKLQIDDFSTDKKNLVSLFADFLLERKYLPSVKSRLPLAFILHDLLKFEREEGESQSDGNKIHFLLLRKLNMLNSNMIQEFVREDLCMLHKTNFETIHRQELNFSQYMASMISFVLGSLNHASHDADNEFGCKEILFFLQNTLEDWIGDNKAFREHLMNLLCLLASRFNELESTGTRLMSLVVSASDVKENNVGNRLAFFEKFFCFIRYVLDHLDSSTYGERYPMDASFVKNDPSFDSLRDHVDESALQSTCIAVSTDGERIDRKKQQTCSFVQTGGAFMNQHWYNCYTCQLYFDKGCCSICAQVCHRGHDVGYSRKSSFFCDCGADSSNLNDHGTRSSCKCVTPLSQPVKTPSGVQGDHNSDNANLSDENEGIALPRNLLLRKELLVETLNRFSKLTKKSVSKFVEILRVPTWTDTLFKLFNQCFVAWAKKKTEVLLPIETFDAIETARLSVSNVSSKQNDTFAEKCLRNGKILNIKHLNKDVLKPLKVSKSNTLNMKLSTDSTADKLKRTHLSKNNCNRHAMVCDSRGRIIIAESSSISFCCAFSIIQRVPKKESSHYNFDRSKLSVLGTSKLKMSVVGMQLCRHNDRHLVLWGVSEACVAILNKDCNQVERKIDLSVDLDPHECEADFFLKCEWVPGSETLVLAICGSFLKIFDIRRSSGSVTDNDVQCRSTTCFTLAYEDVLIRSATLVGNHCGVYGRDSVEILTSACEDNVGKASDVTRTDKDFSPTLYSNQREYSVKLVLLLDNGRLNLTELRVDANGDLEDQGESYIDCGEGLRFSTAGVKRYVGANPNANGSTSTSFGEGCSLVYLAQSDLLLYKCVSAPVIAMKLTKSGKISGSFELLPHVVPSETLGSNSDGHSVSAPFSHWTELGIKKNEDETIYCVACVGKSTRTNQPRLLYMEFSESNVNIKEISWDLKSRVGFGMSASTCIDGMVAFSAPTLVGKGHASGMFNRKNSFIEKVYLCSVNSNGSIYFFEENINLSLWSSSHKDDAPRFLERGTSCKEDEIEFEDYECKETLHSDLPKDNNCNSEPSFPLTIFETLININTDDFMICGDALTDESSVLAAKEKLKIGNTEFLSCPKREGCTLAVCLRKPDKSISNNACRKPMKHSSKMPDDQYIYDDISKVAIAAVRVLLGSTNTEYMPRELSVMGRSIKVIHGMKRWYDIPLTDEEMMLGIRCGFIVIGIGSSIDFSNPPIIDAIEVYGKLRKDVQCLKELPNNFVGDGSCYGLKGRKSRSLVKFNDDNGAYRNALISSILCLTHCCKITKERVNSLNINFSNIQELVQMTALDLEKGGVREYILDLLKQVEPNANSRQKLIDTGTLFGVAEELIKLRTEANNFNLDRYENRRTNSDIMFSSSVKKSLKHMKGIALKTLTQCLQSSLLIVSKRPSNYKNAMLKFISENKLNGSVAIEAKVILDKLITINEDLSLKRKRWQLGSGPAKRNSLGYEIVKSSNDAVSKLIELTLMEMVIDVECKDVQSGSKSQYAKFDLISELLRSGDESVVKCCCDTIAKICGENNSCKIDVATQPQNMNSMESQPQLVNDSSIANGKIAPIAYQCDACELFPITSIRYTLENEDIDLCKKCYDSGCSFANLPGSLESNAVKINGSGLRLGNNRFLSCSQICKMHPFAVENTVVEQVKNVGIIKRNITDPLFRKDPSEMREPEEIDSNNLKSGDADADLQLALQMSLEVLSSDGEIESKDAKMVYGVERKNYPSDLFNLLLSESIKINFFQFESKSNGKSEECVYVPVGSSCGVNHLLQLILILIVNADSDESRFELGKKFAETIISKLSALLEWYSSNNLSETVKVEARISMIIALRALAKLRMNSSSQNASELDSLFNDAELDSTFSGTKNKDKTDPRYVCDVHGVPAVRRRCSHGINKDRRFYLCGMDRKVRCKYFKWADSCDEDSKATSKSTNTADTAYRSTDDVSSPLKKQSKIENNEKMRDELWKLLSSAGTNNSLPMESRICDLLQESYNSLEENYTSCVRESRSSKVLTEDEKASPGNSTYSFLSHLNSLQTSATITQDWLDGVFRSRDIFSPCTYDVQGQSSFEKPEVQKNNNLEPTSISEDTHFMLLEASLNFLSHLATNSLPSGLTSSKIKMNWSPLWFSLLCEIISTSSASLSGQRLEAKSMLKRLCGGRKSTFHKVRDHYVFASQFRKLLLFCEDVLQSAIDVAEKARVCRFDWNKSHMCSWENIGAGGLFGAEGLISEDSFSIECEEKVRKALDELLEITQNRGGNWRQFCAMTELPHAQSKGKNYGSSLLYKSPPILLLLWIACSVSGSNQTKVLRLMNVALTNSESNEYDSGKSSTQRLTFKNSADSTCVVSTDGGNTDGGEGGIAEKGGAGCKVSRSEIGFQGELSSPEHVLLRHSKSLNARDVFTFVVQFVLYGKTKDVRCIASLIAGKMFYQLSAADLNWVFVELLKVILVQARPLGCCCAEILLLLNDVIKCSKKGSLHLREISTILINCFVGQIKGLPDDFFQGAIDDNVSVDSKKTKNMRYFDLESCVYCHRRKEEVVEDTSSGAKTINLTTGLKQAEARSISKSDAPLLAALRRDDSNASNEKNNAKENWAIDQVRPLTRIRLEASSDRVVCTEFAAHIQLKYRLVITEIHLTISDPNKKVKTIGVFFSPRQVGQATELKSNDYSSSWQQCGSISLIRGSTRAICRLSTPIVAANLKFEYQEFYEKVGGSKIEGGNFVLTCPRCTRAVTNAHGVCGHCGEVAFQCRKCRHINYDRLDAFLCIECGFCTSGSFTYELTAANASNAVAIIDDKGYQRAMKLLRLSSRKLASLKKNLKTKVLLLTAKNRKRRYPEDDSELPEYYGRSMKRALLGELPSACSKDDVSIKSSDSSSRRRTGASVVSSRHSDQSGRISAANKARSLLNLARQLRNESIETSADSERVARGDLLVRQALLGAGSGIEFFDDAGELGDDGDIFGIISGGGGSGQSGMLQLDIQDPFSRLVSNIQARVNRTSGGVLDNVGNDSVAGNTDSNNGIADADAASSTKLSLSAQLEECKKLHGTMRETERECYDLQRTINAWKRLNRGSLVDECNVTDAFVPTHCSHCADFLALHFLTLIKSILTADEHKFDFPVSKSFVGALFDESKRMSNSLKDMKRLVVVNLVMKSEQSEDLILNEIRTRLNVSGDSASAEILGSILEKDFQSVDKYIELANEIMSKSY